MSMYGISCFSIYFGIIFNVANISNYTATYFWHVLNCFLKQHESTLNEVLLQENNKHVISSRYFLPFVYASILPFQMPNKVGVNFFYSNCAGCIDDSKCGYCFTDVNNGTCLPSCDSNPDVAIVGLCNTTHLPEDITWAYEWCPSKYSWMTFMGLLLYLLFFAPGMGPMPWTINSEIYPLWARSTCYSIATSVNWLSNFVVSLTFLNLMQAITKYGAFYLYDGLALLGFVFLFLMLPETKGVSLENVDGLFTHPWWKKATTSTKKKTVQCPVAVSFSSAIKSVEESTFQKNDI